MSNRIRHRGVVDSVTKSEVVVRIMQSSACASCQAASLCRSSESKEKLITIESSHSQDFYSGQEVLIEGSLRMGLRAVWIAYVIPTILLISTVIIAVGFNVDEPTAAMIAIAILVAYGLLLWLLRGRIKRRFAFEVMALMIE